MAAWNFGQRWNAIEGADPAPPRDGLEPGEGAVPMVSPWNSPAEFEVWTALAAVDALRVDADCRGDLRVAETGYWAVERLFTRPPLSDENNDAIRSFDELTVHLEVGDLATVGVLVSGDGFELDGTFAAGWCGTWFVEDRPVGAGITCP